MDSLDGDIWRLQLRMIIGEAGGLAKVLRSSSF